MSERGVVSSVYILFVPFGCSTLPLHSALWPMAITDVEFQIICDKFDNLISKRKSYLSNYLLRQKDIYIPEAKRRLHPQSKKTFTSPKKKRRLHPRSKKDVYIPKAKRRLHP